MASSAVQSLSLSNMNMETVTQLLMTPKIAAGIACCLIAMVMLARRTKKNATAAPTVTEIMKTHQSGHVAKTASNYYEFYDESKGENDALAKRKTGYTTMVNNFYDIVTDFYEYGWGRSFHFAPRFRTESFTDSILRHEYFLGAKVGLKPGMKCIDVGCGVGGPMRNIARFTGATIIGINNNDYQIARGTRQTIEENLTHICSFQKADFMKLPNFVPKNSMDAAYAIEATCHAPDPVGCYANVLACMKPGALFGVYEWCTTDKYDARNPEHVRLKKGIEEGDSLPDMGSTDQCLKNLRAAGFEILESQDLALTGNVPWYQPFVPAYTLAGFKTTPVGIQCTHYAVSVLETLRLAPAGTTKAHTVLVTAAAALLRAGELGIFTPAFFVLCRKPKN